MNKKAKIVTKPHPPVGMFVKLTPEEVQEREAALAEQDIELIKLEIEKKDWMQKHKALKAPVGSRRLDLAKQIETGKEWRQVEALEVYDYKRGVVELRTQEDATLISERGMSREERQGDMFADDFEGPDPDDLPSPRSFTVATTDDMTVTGTVTVVDRDVRVVREAQESDQPKLQTQKRKRGRKAAQAEVAE